MDTQCQPRPFSTAEPGHSHAFFHPAGEFIHLTQNLTPNDIAGSDIMKLKASRCRYATLGCKGLTLYQNVTRIHL